MHSPRLSDLQIESIIPHMDQPIPFGSPSIQKRVHTFGRGFGRAVDSGNNDVRLEESKPGSNRLPTRS